MQTSQLRWGILGVAAINERLLPAFRAARTAELRAIASRSPEKAKAAAEAMSIPYACGSYDELLSRDDIDAVYIPLPNHLHAEWTMKAADRGKHVLCEKPLGMNAKEAEEMVKHCRARSVRLMDGFMWPHHPRTAKLRTFLDAGSIGDVLQVNAAFTFMLEGLPTTNIRMQRAAGGGGLMDVGCYCVYAIRWWMQSEPARVFARATFINDVDVAMSGVLTFADGRTTHFDCGFTQPLRTWVEIVGAKGVVRVPNHWIPDDFACFKVNYPGEGFEQRSETIGTPGENQMVQMLDNFATAVFENREAVPDPTEAVRTLRVLDALAASARTGREISI